MNTIYNVDYFLAKFSAIPEDQWICHSQIDEFNRRCALGHCMLPGMTEHQYLEDYTRFSGHLTKEGHELGILFSPQDLSIEGAIIVATINNGVDPNYWQPTPKQRVLAALRDIKAKQGQVEISDPPVYIEDLIGEEVTA